MRWRCGHSYTGPAGTRTSSKDSHYRIYTPVSHLLPSESGGENTWSSYSGRSHTCEKLVSSELRSFPDLPRITYRIRCPPALRLLDATSVTAMRAAASRDCRSWAGRRHDSVETFEDFCNVRGGFLGRCWNNATDGGHKVLREVSGSYGWPGGLLRPEFCLLGTSGTSRDPSAVLPRIKAAGVFPGGVGDGVCRPSK